ncbi:MAG: triphosphoribosyl-dephospho-CoA synthetase [Planctomycetes bacterium]|nr:triphosphoribosyl-dephospho-CoA synthetase [Planctomycetota bacterium]
MNLAIGECATLACLLEVAAPKPGNVHRGADFEDLKFADFLASATVIGPILDRAVVQGVGWTVREAVRSTIAIVGTNTNLGIILLLSPLAAVPRECDLESGIAGVLADLGESDAQRVYEAIRLAKPGGMGTVEQMDLNGPPPPSLLEAMRLAASRDLVANQYATGFRDIFRKIVPSLLEDCRSGLPLSLAVVHTQLKWLSQNPDSLIARKCGLETARQATEFAKQVLACGEPFSEPFERGLADFDFWLRADGNRRNPGTTADLLTAGIFVVLRERYLAPPYR